MRAHEFESNKIDNILFVLANTENEKLLPFVEKTLQTSKTEDVNKSKENRLQAIYAALKNADDDRLIDFIESKLKQVEIGSRVDAAWSARGFDTGRMSKYRESFKDLMLRSSGSIKSKVQLLYDIRTNTRSISEKIFQTSFESSIDGIMPERIKNNPVFQSIKDIIFFNDSFRGKGIGPGEFALALFGEKGNIVDDKGDVVIGSVGIEIKDGAGGSIKTGSANSFRAADKLRDWMGKQVGVPLDRKNKLYWNKPSAFSDAFNELEPAKRLSLALEYVKQLYPEIDSSDQSNLAQGLAKHAGSPDVTKFFGEALLNSYKNQDKWDSILFITKSGLMVNLVNASDAIGKVDFGLAGVNRDGDTQALPDGYINGFIIKSKGTKRRNSSIKKPTEPKFKIKTAKQTQQSASQPQLPPSPSDDLRKNNDAENRFLAALTEPSNPITGVWKKISSQYKADAKDYAIELVLSGKTDPEIAQDLASDFL